MSFPIPDEPFDLVEPILPDLLKLGLRIVFCGTAPSAFSVRERAYYAKPGNQFWPVLHRMGLTPTQLSPHEYARLLDFGIGLTDLCKTAFGNDDQLPDDAIDRAGLTEKIATDQPSILAFTSKHGAQLYLGKRVEFGINEAGIGATRIYTCCSTSGRARRFWREGVWLELAALARDLGVR